MSDYNRVILLGRLGNKPELKKSTEGKSYLRLSIATHSHRTGEPKATFWHRVVVFGIQAEYTARYLDKGSPVLVEGHLEESTYTNSKDEKVRATNVVAHQIQFLGGRGHATVEGDVV